MKLFPALILSSTVLALIACSGGGGNRVAGIQCPVNHSLAVILGQKLWKKGDNQSSIPEGTYTYQRADMVFTEKGNDGVTIHVQDTLLKNGTFQASVYCMRNGLSLQGRTISAAAPVASKVVSKTGSTEALSKELSVSMVDGRLKAFSKELASASAPESLDKVYDGKADSYELIEHPNKVDYELRSTYSDNSGDYVVSVRFTKAP